MVGESWRGPHNFKEYELMRDGLKPAALVDALGGHQLPQRWVALLETGKFIAAGFLLNGERPAYIVARAGDERRLLRLVEEFGSTGRDHFKIGLLLGYKWEHVARFCEEGGRYSRGKEYHHHVKSTSFSYVPQRRKTNNVHYRGTDQRVC